MEWLFLSLSFQNQLTSKTAFGFLSLVWLWWRCRILCAKSMANIKAHPVIGGWDIL
jgi:hypothetical protein